MSQANREHKRRKRPEPLPPASERLPGPPVANATSYPVNFTETQVAVGICMFFSRGRSRFLGSRLR
jgi:hypothetical protein